MRRFELFLEIALVVALVALVVVSGGAVSTIMREALQDPGLWLWRGLLVLLAIVCAYIAWSEEHSRGLRVFFAGMAILVIVVAYHIH